MKDGTDERSSGETQEAADLLPALYTELRRLAAALTAQRGPGQTLTPTTLVHEAYLRLVKGQDPGWQGPRHFFGAVARAMREILIEQARRKARLKRVGGGHRIELGEGLAWIEPSADDVLALDEAISQLQTEDARLAEIVRLRYYSGPTVEETARVVSVSVSTLTRDWRYARARPGFTTRTLSRSMRRGSTRAGPSWSWSCSMGAVWPRNWLRARWHRARRPS
jgi:RNA polymerase sigma factor (TIGR02999 family)